jgi:hypothetical protein
MPEEEPIHASPIGPLDWLKLLPFEPAASSDRLGWAGLEAARNLAVPASELHAPAITHHRLILFSRPPEELDLLYEGVKRHVPPPAGAILVVPAGSPTLWRWSGSFHSFHIFLEPGLVSRVAAEAFDLDPARLTIPPLDGLDLAHLRAAMGASGCRVDGRRRRGEPRRRVAGQRPGRPPDPARFGGPPVHTQAGRHAPPSEAPRGRRVYRGIP